MKAKSEQQKEFNKIVRDVLSDQKLTMQEQKELEDLYGADNVTFLLNELRNRKNKKSNEEDHSISNPTNRGS
jgi:hypothetical protein